MSFSGLVSGCTRQQIRGVWRFARDWGRVELGDEAGNKPVETFPVGIDVIAAGVSEPPDALEIRFMMNRIRKLYFV